MTRKMTMNHPQVWKGDQRPGPIKGGKRTAESDFFTRMIYSDADAILVIMMMILCDDD